MIGTLNILTWFTELPTGRFLLLMARKDVEIASYFKIQGIDVREKTVGRE
jgi:hypothetical protein